jgi:hypothetical protein
MLGIVFQHFLQFLRNRRRWKLRHSKNPLCASLVNHIAISLDGRWLQPSDSRTSGHPQSYRCNYRRRAPLGPIILHHSWSGLDGPPTNFLRSYSGLIISNEYGEAILQDQVHRCFLAKLVARAFDFTFSNKLLNRKINAAC